MGKMHFNRILLHDQIAAEILPTPLLLEPKAFIEGQCPVQIA